MPDSTIGQSVRAWLMCTRPKTWGVAMAPVAVGLAFALALSGSVRWTVAAATLLLSVCMQVISNMENDAGYSKLKAERSNRKGLPRATSLGLLSIGQVEWAIRAVAAICVIDMLYLMYAGGWVIVLITLASITAAYTYMGGPRPTAYSPFGELLVLIFFGLTAVCGTYYLQTRSIAPSVILGGLALGLIAAAVLAVNNYRDREHDESIGRKTLAVLIGSSGMRDLYLAMLILPYALTALMIAGDPRLLPSVTVFITVPQALRLIRDFRVRSGLELNAVMFGTVRLELMFSALMTLGVSLAYFNMAH